MLPDGRSEEDSFRLLKETLWPALCGGQSRMSAVARFNKYTMYSLE